MDGIHPRFTVTSSFSLILLVLLQTSAEAQICTAPLSVNIAENNRVNDVVMTITVQAGVTLEFTPPVNPDNPFILQDNQLVAVKVLDAERNSTVVVQITCTELATESQLKLVTVVVVDNLNDNPPVFNQNPYNVEVSETAPTGFTVGTFAATDLDKHPQLHYTLTGSNDFILKTPTNPEIIVNARLDYDTTQNVQLVLEVRDVPLEPGDSTFSATTTIMVTILDEDNRPPWFHPCTRHSVNGVVICQNTGYTGNVVQNEQATGALLLKPGPLYATDGDSGINEEIIYSFLSGNDDGVFEINANSGNITMRKAATTLEDIHLTVMAAQKTSSHQFTTTTVTISVRVKSLHPPQFEKRQYEGIITSAGTMAMELNNPDVPLRIIATDDDYTAIRAAGVNPYITYSIEGSSDFTLINGYLFMTTDLLDGTLSLTVEATDESTGEPATAQLSVEVKSGLTTTTTSSTTTDITTTTSVGESTTDSQATSPTMSTDSSVSTANPGTASESTVPTTDSSMSTEGSLSTPNPSPSTGETFTTADPVIPPSGEYKVEDMVALGVTLGILLLICLVVIGVLAHRLKRGKADWRKIHETSMFRSALGQGSGGQKEGIQYTNEAYQKDEDEHSIGSSGPDDGKVMAAREVEKPAWSMKEEAIQRSSAPLHALLSDNSSDVGSENADSEKEVKPILTKERRVEEGYKSVWFKEDIDPNAKEEVVIIEDNREDDSEEEEEEASSSGREDSSSPRKPKVLFTEGDLDSGLGVRIEDPAEDSEREDSLTADL